MRSNEVQQLLRFAATYQANLRVTSPEEAAELARAWYMALDTRLELQNAMAICAELASEQKRLHPGTINEAFLYAIRPPEQQGLGKPHLPFATKPVERRVPLAIGAPEPVAPKDVPEYSAYRKAVHDGKARVARAESVACPYCSAEVGQHCVSGSGRRLTHRLTHPSREDALRAVRV